MHNSWLTTLLLCTVGLVAGAAIGVVLVIAALPGTWLSLTRTAHPRTAALRSAVGSVLAIGVVSYLALSWVAIVVTFIVASASGASGVGKWLAWCAAFLIATLPSSATLKNLHANWPPEWEGKQEVYTALCWAWILAPLGFLIFAVTPHTMTFGWTWVGHVVLPRG